MTLIPVGRHASPSDPLRTAILASGRGSNMEAIVRRAQAGTIPVDVRVVLSNRLDAPALARARALGIKADARAFREPGEADPFYRWLVDTLEEEGIEVIALAGFMRILPGWVVEKYPWRILNIHPSLLPAFPGLRPHEQALAHGVKCSGCTVHLVDDSLDGGPIMLQEAVAVLDDDTPERLAARILEVEHRLYPEALALMASGTLRLSGRRLVRLSGDDPTERMS